MVELEARLARDLELLLVPPAKQWLEPRVHPQWGPVLDVAIIGAGMGGLAAAFALKRLGVRNMQLFDRSPEGFEGPWATYARMQTLRSPPELVGPALGLANLTFRAWFEAQFGRDAWKAVHRIPRLQWMDYLRWYRRMIDVPIENEVEITRHHGRQRGGLPRPAVGSGRASGRRAPRGAGDGTRRPWRAVRAGAVSSPRPPLLGALQRRHRFRRAPRQDRGA